MMAKMLADASKQEEWDGGREFGVDETKKRLISLSGIGSGCWTNNQAFRRTKVTSKNGSIG